MFRFSQWLQPTRLHSSKFVKSKIWTRIECNFKNSLQWFLLRFTSGIWNHCRCYIEASTRRKKKSFLCQHKCSLHNFWVARFSLLFLRCFKTNSVSMKRSEVVNIFCFYFFIFLHWVFSFEAVGVKFKRNSFVLWQFFLEIFMSFS